MSTVTRVANVLLLICGPVVLAGCRPIFPPAFAATSRVYLQPADPSHEGRYVIAQGKDDYWSLRQLTEFSDCGWLTLYDLDKDGQGHRRITLKTCNDRFVTVPRGDTTRPDRRSDTRRDRMAWQELRPGDCAEFTVEPQSDGTFAFRTCGGRYLSAGNDGPGWESPVAWAIVVENSKVEAWEKFKMLPQP